jgi:catechol 2,3-dioxygenase-like lactoylglutathione lyase family enzyme
MARDYYIRGIQQIGIGVADLFEAWRWYRKVFGVDVKVFDDDSVAEFMLPYTGNEPQQRHAIMALNLQGGGGFEIWQYKGRVPQAPAQMPKLGDYGIFACKIKAPNVSSAFDSFRAAGVPTSKLCTTPDQSKSFFVTDPYGNVFQVVHCDTIFRNEKKPTGAVGGAIIGVKDFETAKKVYMDILGYGQVVYDKQGEFDDLKELNGGKSQFRRVLLRHFDKREGGFGKLLGPTEIELVQLVGEGATDIFKDRFWGDLGFIHLCFDVQRMQQLRSYCESKGHPFTVDSLAAQEGKSFDMGEAAGLFSYIEDGNGTLIEFVEAHKLPIIKALGITLDLRKRDPQKPVPDWMLNALRFSKHKD